MSQTQYRLGPVIFFTLIAGKFTEYEIHPFKMNTLGGFPGGPVVKTIDFYCKGHGFRPWWGSLDPTYSMAQPNKIK